jgi:hypothetical protein
MRQNCSILIIRIWLDEAAVALNQILSGRSGLTHTLLSSLLALQLYVCLRLLHVSFSLEVS